MDDALNKPGNTGGTSKDTVGARRTARVVILIRALVAGSAVVMSIWAGCPWLGSAGLGLLGAIAIAAELSPLRPSAPRWEFGLAVAFGLSLLVPATPLFVADAHFSLDEYGPYYQAVLAWLVAVSVVPARIRADNPGRLRLAAMSCALIGDMLWLAGSWSDNLRGVCYLGLLVTVALLVLCKLWFRLPDLAVVGVNTLLLLIFVVGTVDLFVPPPPRLDPDPEAGWKHSYETAREGAARLDPHLAASRKYYSYETARKDPAAFARWWACQAEQWRLMSKDIVVPDGGQAPAWHLRPGARSRFFDCPISINSLGFRGKEIRREKGHAYRIVALGESTTFGGTLGLEDKPWPELLEQMIRERLNPRRPVEVINAGVAAYTVLDNLHRLARDVLPLKPDMIISYHGYNGFPMLDQSLPVVYGPAPPVYSPLPLTLVANFEYRLKLLRYRRRQTARLAPHPKTVSDVMSTGIRPCLSRASSNHQDEQHPFGAGQFLDGSQQPKRPGCYRVLPLRLPSGEAAD